MPSDAKRAYIKILSNVLLDTSWVFFVTLSTHPVDLMKGLSSIPSTLKLQAVYKNNAVESLFIGPPWS